MCNINHSKFPYKICAKKSKTKTKLFSATFVNFVFTLNVTTLIIQITGIFKTVTNPGIAQNAAAIFPFNSLSSNKNFLACSANTDSNITQWKDLEHDHNSSLLLKPSSNLGLLVNQFNNATPENGNDPKKIASSKYYDTDEMHTIEIPHKDKPLYLFHINACSLSKNFDDLQHLLSSTKKIF